MTFNFIKFPLFMSRRKKREVLDAMLKSMEKAGRKKHCDICKRKFKKKDSRWAKDDFTSSICILCHKEYFKMKIKDYYMEDERKEIMKLKKQIGTLNNRKR